MAFHIPENIQQEAARIVTGENKLASKNSLYIETGWIPLYKRRVDHRLIQLFKIYHNKTPIQTLANLIIPSQSI